MATRSTETFLARLARAAGELDAAAVGRASRLAPIEGLVPDTDVALFEAALERGILTLEPCGRLNTPDRPQRGGRFELVVAGEDQLELDARCLSQIAAYAHAVLELGYPAPRVLVALPERSLGIDLAIVDDVGAVIVLGEVLVDPERLHPLRRGVLARFVADPPPAGVEPGRDDACRLAVRLWTVRPDYLWLVGPGRRLTYRCAFEPLVLEPVDELPPAVALGLDHLPSETLLPPVLH